MRICPGERARTDLRAKGMLERGIYIRFRRALLAVPFIAAVGAIFLLAPRLWAWYSPLLGVIAFGVGLLLLLPIIPVLVFRWYDPPASAFMLETSARLRRLGHAQPLAYQWVKLSQISSQMCLAVIVAEDFTFPIHNGVIWHSMASAHEANQGTRNRDYWRGGSTISQQLVKNLFLWPARSYLRKGIELYLTFLVEMLWPKWRILEVYLNIVQLGENLFGVQAASRAYFGKPASELSAEEGALLAAALPNPMLYPVNQPPPRMRFRQAMILNGMKNINPQYMDYMSKIGLYIQKPADSELRKSVDVTSEISPRQDRPSG